MTAGLEIIGLSKRFGAVRAVDGIDLEVPRGSLIGFLGPNGAGKTTTMRSIVGMVRPDAGEIRWDGQVLGDDTRSSIGYMPQERGLYARMKTHEQVSYFAQLSGMDKTTAARRADHWLDRVGLSERRDDLVQELSGGNQQRVQLAVSLVHDPELLVLDEPFAGLDPVAAETMRSIISDRAAAGASVLFSSHQLDLVENLCEEVVIIAEGRRVAAGAIADLRSGSSHRRMVVRWHDTVDAWHPLEGEMVSFDNRRAVVDLPCGTDIAAHAAHALTAGPVDEFRIEPPGLDDVFVELVGGDG